ncbi:MAG: hypothetical protein K8H84_03855 [Sulfuricella denitrificans]|nr:hypothetical protein [Sulfuricella denitrificans]
MKKLSIALAVAGAFAATGASAVVLGEYDQGCLVPSAIHSATSNTVVGITARHAGTVYWTFFDVNSNHVSDGQFAVTANDMYSYSMSALAGALTAGTQGYLTFSHSSAGGGVLSTSESIACNAFYVTTGDAAYIPAVALTQSDYTAGAAANLTTLGATSIDSLKMGNGFVNTGSPLLTSAMAATHIDLRYWIDGATGGRDTAVVIWTANNAIGNYTVNMYDDAQNRQSVTLALANQELNIYNPEAQVGRPATFVDGFVNFSLSAALQSGILSYSVVSDPAFGATQTLMNASR